MSNTTQGIGMCQVARACLQRSCEEMCLHHTHHRCLSTNLASSVINHQSLAAQLLASEHFLLFACLFYLQHVLKLMWRTLHEDAKGSESGKGGGVGGSLRKAHWVSVTWGIMNEWTTELFRTQPYCNVSKMFIIRNTNQSLSQGCDCSSQSTSDSTL